jgi:hypothetical protein
VEHPVEGISANPRWSADFANQHGKLSGYFRTGTGSISGLIFCSHMWAPTISIETGVTLGEENGRRVPS